MTGSNRSKGAIDYSILMAWTLSDSANLSTVVTGVVAVFALGGAIWQVIAARGSQREATASSLYGNYLELAVEHPKLASGTVAIPSGKSFDEEFERYEWFVSVMLHAFEQILDLVDSDKVWVKAIKDQIDYHEAYLASDGFVRGHYSETLQDLFP